MGTKNLLIITLCFAFLIAACISAGCTSGQNNQGPVASGQITIKDMAFSPETLTIHPGTVVTWTNMDATPHSVESDTGTPITFASADLAPGDSYSFTFRERGTYGYHCSLHPAMKGTIFVQT